MRILEYFFGQIIYCVGAMYALLAVLFVFIKVPHHMGLRHYRQSKYLLAACFAVMSFNLFAWLFVFNDNWHQASDMVAGIDLVLYYLAGIFYSFAFSNLLDKHYISGRRIALASTKWIVSTTCVLIALFGSIPSHTKTILLTVSLFILLWFISQFLYSFFRRFRKVNKALTSYWSEDQRKAVDWIYRCILLVVISGLLGIISIRQGVVYNIFYQLYVVGSNLYLAISFINFRDYYSNIKRTEEVIEAMEKIEPEDISSNSNADDSINQLEQKVTEWVTGKKYIQGQFTIEDMAIAIGTNKTYLSAYINRKYGTSFSTWITSLRIEDAKLLMLQDSDMKLRDIAMKVGFSSSSYFSKAFSIYEGTTPSIWKQQKILFKKQQE